MNYTSTRLYFREFEEKDLDLFSSIFTNEQIMRYALYNCYTDKNELQKYFEEVLENNKTVNQRKCYEFAVFQSSDNVFAGFAGIDMKYVNGMAVSGEIGYFLLPSFWGRGYATEIARTLTDYCFKKIGLHRVIASCNARNSQSERVMQKVGMVKEGEFRKARFKNGQWDNELRYAILVEEWNQSMHI